MEEQQRAYDLLTAIRHASNARRGDVRLVCAPLRICPLGAHINHQLGLVTGMTIDALILLENIEFDRCIENEYIGLNSGILDQSVILLSDCRHLTFMDCQSADHSQIPSPLDRNDFDILVVYSGLSRSLVSTDCNRRVSQCQMAAGMLLEWAGQPMPPSPRLRMVPSEVFGDYECGSPHLISLYEILNNCMSIRSVIPMCRDSTASTSASRMGRYAR